MVEMQDEHCGLATVPKGELIEGQFLVGLAWALEASVPEGKGNSIGGFGEPRIGGTANIGGCKFKCRRLIGIKGTPYHREAYRRTTIIKSDQPEIFFPNLIDLSLCIPSVPFVCRQSGLCEFCACGGILPSNEPSPLALAASPGTRAYQRVVAGGATGQFRHNNYTT